MQLRQTKHISLLTLWLACISASIAHSADPVEDLKACAKMTDRDARFACYDSLGKRVLEEESADQKSPPQIVVEPGTAETAGETSSKPSLPDDIGGADFEEQSGLPKAQNKGLITSCKQAPDKRWYFYFDNGQVWKESNTGRRRFKECDFIATITRDGFGYRMQIDGETRKIRVSRIR